MYEFQVLLPNGHYMVLTGNLLVPQENKPSVLYGEGSEVVALIPVNIPVWKINNQKPD